MLDKTMSIIWMIRLFFTAAIIAVWVAYALSGETREPHECWVADTQEGQDRHPPVLYAKKVPCECYATMEQAMEPFLGSNSPDFQYLRLHYSYKDENTEERLKTMRFIEKELRRFDEQREAMKLWTDAKRCWGKP